MLLGYVIWGADCKSHMLADRIGSKCDKYRNVYDINYVDVLFKPPKTKYDLSVTYDGYVIVSSQFKRFCEIQEYSDLEFVPLVLSANFFWFKIHSVVEFDAASRKTRFIDYNEECKGYGEIIGAAPVHLKRREQLHDGFFRTDICFGSFESKSPLNLVGVETKNKITNANLRGFYFEEIHDKYL